jgi:hypothetical protein
VRSTKRLRMKPGEFRQNERAEAEQHRRELHELTSKAIANREPWVVWLLEVWRPRRLRGRD